MAKTVQKKPQMALDEEVLPHDPELIRKLNEYDECARNCAELKERKKVIDEAFKARHDAKDAVIELLPIERGVSKAFRVGNMRITVTAAEDPKEVKRVFRPRVKIETILPG